MIVATAGHVDHGKTALVRALTGKDTDTLAEEKRRGLTISPGFAYVNIARGRIGFIDVPGHHQFIHNMLSGVAGIDATLLVIAADEGVMPQTIEHLRILDLLKPGQGLLAITKTDRTDEVTVGSVDHAVRTLTRDTFLADAPVVHTSTTTGEGIDDLREHLARMAARVAQRSADGCFRMAIDRAFTLKGTGVVATGTVHAGQINVDDSLVLAPTGIEVRARGIYSENQAATTATAGHRCAINLTGIELAMIKPGDWLTTGDAVMGSTRVDVRLQLPHDATRAVRHWTPVHIFHGATHTTGRLALLEGRTIEPGDEGLAQLVTDSPIVAIHGDRCILRNQASDETLAGAFVLDVFAPMRGRAKRRRLEHLRQLQTNDPRQCLTTILSSAGETDNNGISLEPFRKNWNLTLDEAEKLTIDSGVALIQSDEGPCAISIDRLRRLRDQVLGNVQRWHDMRPEATGIRLNELYESFEAGISRPILEATLQSSILDHEIKQTGPYYHSPDFKPRLPDSESATWQTISAAITDNGPRPPTVQEIAEIIGMDTPRIVAALERATRMKLAVQIEPRRFFLHDSINALKALITEMALTATDGLVTTAAYRDASGLGRNLTIAVLEYFDATKFTRRIGNARRVMKRPD